MDIDTNEASMNEISTELTDVPIVGAFQRLVSLLSMSNGIADHQIAVRAMRQTGSSNVVGDDLREPLAILCDSLVNEAELSRARSLDWARYLGSLLERRFTFRATLRDSATISDASPGRPIIVTSANPTLTSHALRVLSNVAQPLGDVGALSLFSFRFETNAHIPAYSEWLSGEQHVAPYASIAQLGEDAHSRISIGGVTHLERAEEISSTLDATTLVIRDDTASNIELANRFVQHRMRNSNALSASQTEKYFQWRIDNLIDASQTLSDLESAITIDATQLYDQPSAIIELASTQ